MEKEKSKIYKWAENECRLACKRENPDFNFDSDEFDYGCSCYKSALKAYGSLTEDGHSGFSWGITVSILMRLMSNLPLTSVTEDDFDINDKMTYGKDDGSYHIQCRRMSSLFMDVDKDGNKKYHDVDRVSCINIENPGMRFSNGMYSKIVDDMFPISLPYYPLEKNYTVYCHEYLRDRKHGDYDTMAMLYIECPDGNRIDVNIFWMELDDGTTIEITEQEYNSMMKDRIDLPSIKFAELVIDRLDEDFGLDVTKDAEERIYKACSIFDNSQYWKYNTSGYRSRIVNGDTDKLKDEPNLVKLSETIQDIISNLTPKKDAE